MTPSEVLTNLKDLKAGFFVQVPHPRMRRVRPLYGEVLVTQKVLKLKYFTSCYMKI